MRWRSCVRRMIWRKRFLARTGRIVVVVMRSLCTRRTMSLRLVAATGANAGRSHCNPNGPGRFRLVQSPGPVLDQFARRLAENSGAGDILQGIHREIATVRSDFSQLREAKRRLEAMVADGLFKFVQKIDLDSLRAVCAILAHGDVAKAGRVLNLADSTLRDLVRAWQRKGKEYKPLLDLVRWRKKMGSTELVRFDELILQKDLVSADYPALISDVLDGILSVDAENWRERCEELAEMLRPHANA